jgi:hypothetical protein
MENVFLIVHVFAGFIALSSGTVIMLMRKGGAKHVKLGRVFFWSMMLVVFSALYLAITKNNGFLLGVGLFVFYQAFAGMRSAVKHEIPFNFWDSIVLIIALLNAVFMVSTGNIILLVFGIISFTLVGVDLRAYYAQYKQKTLPKLAWLRRHIGMMVGAYIGTFTAFLVVNIQLDGYQWLVWLGPTFLFVPLMNYWQWTFTRKGFSKKTLAVCSIFLLLNAQSSSFAQPYVDGGKTRHRFAQLNLGTDFRIFSQNQTNTFTLSEEGNLMEQSLGNMAESRLIIGGTHFWGHADFFVAISMYQWAKTNFHTNVETGARYFPWQIKSGRIAPFVGLSWMTNSYKQGEGVYASNNDFPVSAGLVFERGHHLFELSVSRSLRSQQKYYISRTQDITVDLPKFWMGIGYKFMLETTVGAEKNWLNGETARTTEKLAAAKRLNGLTLAIGPSSAILLKSSDYNQINHPFLGQHRLSNIFMELGIGYYFQPIDFHVNIAYRHVKSTIAAYGLRQTLARRSVTLEGIKFIGDFHGFVPFIGAGIGGECLSLKEVDIAIDPVELNRQKLHPGLVFGWDIRPNELQTWYLRTNLRWFPNLNMKDASGLQVNFDQLEFNFIQFVLFPGRLF